jgi:phospholipid/cholesterol/gamma-HCH transport system substrate-binding protein
MSATDNKRSVIVGLFVFIGLMILIGGILVLGGQQNKFASTVTVSTEFEDVAGLKAGNNVWFSGVKVGTVKEVNFRGIKKVEVILSIEEKSRNYIRKNASAKLGSDGFIGNKLVVIEGGSGEAPAIEDGDIIASIKGSDTDALIASLQVNSKNFETITEDFKVLSGQLAEGKGTVGAVLTDSLMAEHLRMMIQNLQVTTTNTVKASAALNTLMAKLDGEGTLVNDLLTDTVIYQNLAGAVAQLQGITQTASALVTNLDGAVQKVNRTDNTIGVLLNDEASAANIKQILQNLETSTEKLDQNMEALQHNFLFRGFFRKQAKEAEKQK